MIHDHKAMQEVASWLALLMAGLLKRQDAKGVIQRWCVDEGQPLSAAFLLSPGELESRLGLTTDQAAQMVATQAQVGAQRDLLEQLGSSGIGVLTRTDVAYPENLALRLPEGHLPYLFFYTGELSLLTQPGITLLGAAAPDAMAQRAVEDLAARLARDGYALVGGYAKGVDRLALDAAREAGGQIVVVLPMGIRRFLHSYTGFNALLRQERALLLSPFAPDAEPTESAAQARLSLVTALSELVSLFGPDRRPGNWPALDAFCGWNLPALVWSGSLVNETQAWLEAGTMSFAEASKGLDWIRQLLGMECDDSALLPSQGAPRLDADAGQDDAAAFRDAESAIEMLNQSGRVPEVLARRLREIKWD